MKCEKLHVVSLLCRAFVISFSLLCTSHSATVLLCLLKRHTKTSLILLGLIVGNCLIVDQKQKVMLKFA